MRITHVYDLLDPRGGGPPPVIAGLARGQQSLGHEVELVSRDPPGAPELERFLAERLEPVPVRHAIDPGRTLLPVGPAARALARVVRGSDVVHLHGVWSPLGLLAGQLCRRAGVPYVLTPHGMLHTAAMGQRWLKKGIGLFVLGFRRLLSEAAAMHALTEEEARLPWFLKAPRQTRVIPNGLFEEEFRELPAPGDFRATVPGLGDAPFVLFLSRVQRLKGPDLLAEAFAVLARTRPDVHVVLAGPDQGAQADFEARIARHGLSARAHAIGPRFGRARLGAMRDAAVFCLPSRVEGFSVALIEALACGAPCVATTACNLPLITREGLGVETAIEPEAIAEGLRTVLADPEAARRMGQRGREIVLSRFTWPSIAAEMVALYRDCLAGAAGR